MLLGRQRVERHYDADGNLTGHTVVDPAFTRADLDALDALALYESKVCNGCGWHESQADEANDFDFQNRHCVVCGWSAQHGRAQTAADEKEAERLKSDPLEPRQSDGRHTHIKMTPARLREATRKG